jgi:hypothetical protein
MADSAEHKFISNALDRALGKFSETRLLGLREAERRTFDFGCILLRDFSRPLVSQVLWNHEGGIEKDLRTLLFDGGSSLRLYFVRDRIRNRMRIDEALKSYREKPETTRLLRGLRIIPIPEEFDADVEKDQLWLDYHVRHCISTDLLFGVVFGKLTAHDIKAFSEHGGPFGLRLAALQIIAEFGLHHGPTFEQQVGSRGSPLREAVAMLTGVGFVASLQGSIQRVPTLKGRFLLDFARRLEFERRTARQWSPEITSIMAHLRLDPPPTGSVIDVESAQKFKVLEILNSVSFAKSQFGVDVMKDINLEDPKFYSEFHWKKFATGAFHRGGREVWDDDDDLPIVT